MSEVSSILASVEDADSIVSRGYHLGYVRAMAHTRTGFTHRLPMRYLGAVCELLRDSGSEFKISVYVVEKPNRYELRFVRVLVEFSGSSERVLEPYTSLRRMRIAS